MVFSKKEIGRDVFSKSKSEEVSFQRRQRNVPDSEHPGTGSDGDGNKLLG